jgi:hypothetical protein
MNITVEAKVVHGRTLVYPICDMAKLLCKLTDKITLTPNNIDIIKKLGYTFEQLEPKPI